MTKWGYLGVIAFFVCMVGVGVWHAGRNEREIEQLNRETERVMREVRQREYAKATGKSGRTFEMLTPEGDVMLVPDDDHTLGAAFARGWILRNRADAGVPDR